MSNVVAPAGQVWVCGACGKRSRDLYGNQVLSRGWDESCMLNAVLCYEDKLTLDDHGRVIHVADDGVICTRREMDSKPANTAGRKEP